MFVNDTERDQYRPSYTDLADYHCVHADADIHKPKEMRDWAHEHCTSLAWWELIDMSDISSWHGPDNCASFYFRLESDALLFRLKWK